MPAGARRPRDEAVAEPAAGLVEGWAAAPADGMASCALGGFNGFRPERARRPSARPSSAREGPRDSVHEAGRRPRMQPPPAERCEMRGRRGCEAAPDCRVAVDCMRRAAPLRLTGGQAGVGPTGTAATATAGGGAAAGHGRPRGRRGRHPTVAGRMPPAHAAMGSPRPPERSSSRAHGTGAGTGAAADGPPAGRPVAERASAPARNMPGPSETCSPGPLGRARARPSALGAVPGCTAPKDAMPAIGAAGAEARAPGRPPEADGGPVDRAESAGRLRGADAYRRGGDRGCRPGGASACSRSPG